MRTYQSDKRGKIFISLTGFILTIILIVLLNLLRLYVIDKYPQYLPDMTRVRSLPEKVIAGIMIALGVMYLVFIVLILPMWYKSFKYVIYENRIVSYSGIFSRTFRIMRIGAIQHASHVSMPFSKYTCFNFIRLSALGGNIIMFFLSDEDCRSIMAFIDEFAEKPARKETAPAPLPEKPVESYAVAEDGQEIFPDLADVIRKEMEQLAFFEELTDMVPTPAEAAEKPAEPDPMQIDFFPSPAVQLSFDDKAGAK